MKLVQNDGFQVLFSFVLARNPLQLRPLSEFEREYENYQRMLQFEHRGLHEMIAKAHSLTGSSNVASSAEPSVTRSDGSEWQRRPERTLYLVIRDEGTRRWRFPHFPVSADRFEAKDRDDLGPVEEDELPQNPMTRAKVLRHRLALKAPLRTFLDSAARRLFGQKCVVHVPASRPCAHWKEALTERTARPRGFHSFYFSAQWLAGELSVSSSSNDVKWLASDELAEHIGSDCMTAIAAALQE